MFQNTTLQQVIDHENNKKTGKNQNIYRVAEESVKAIEIISSSLKTLSMNIFPKPMGTISNRIM